MQPFQQEEEHQPQSLLFFFQDGAVVLVWMFLQYPQIPHN